MLNLEPGGEPPKGGGNMVSLTIQGDTIAVALLVLIVLSTVASAAKDKR